MAGDWIKVEKATPGKPEVMAVADELGGQVVTDGKVRNEKGRNEARYRITAASR